MRRTGETSPKIVADCVRASAEGQDVTAPLLGLLVGVLIEIRERLDDISSNIGSVDDTIDNGTVQLGREIVAALDDVGRDIKAMKE